MAKPIIIELSRGESVYQPMLSKLLRSCNVENVFFEANELTNNLRGQGFVVNRLKIEVPAESFELFADFNLGFAKYFEWHGKVNYINPEYLNLLCEKHFAHLSSNALKNAANTRFITMREFGTKLTFENRIVELVKELIVEGWVIIKHESEYCIYDNNSFMDNGWLHK